MNIILFLFLALGTVFISIKLSYYTDKLDKQSNVGSFFIGGILLAVVTSIPELVTSLSAININNPYLSVGDILGSNIFNLFAIGIFDLAFIKHMIFNKISYKYSVFIVLLIINYLFIYFSFTTTSSFSINYIGIPTIIIIISYLIFLYLSSFIKPKNKEITIKKDNSTIYKFLLTSIFMIIISYLLTITVDNITKTYSLVSVSSVGAFLLGITTSLPEVVSSLTLIKYKNYTVALSNIIGSNMFNLLILSITDILFKKSSLYNYVESSSILMIKICIVTSILVIISLNKKIKNKFIYIMPTLLLILSYIFMMVIELKII